MQRTLSRTLYGSLAAGASILLLAAATWSMPPVDGGWKDPQHLITHMTERLDLDVQQRESVQAVVNESMTQNGDDRARLHSLRSQLRAMSGTFDAEEARRMADEIGAITARLVYSMASTRAQIHGLLTDEQRQELEKMMSRSEQRRDHWRARRRQGDTW